MEKENRHNCPVCGGFDFMKENGYFYCVECQTQCEGIREQVFEEQTANDNEERLIGTPFVTKKRKKGKKKRKGEVLTSWEMYNCVLRGLVDELISLGAPKTIKDTVLQLWAYYLQKLEVAFYSHEKGALPKLSIKYHAMDAEFIYGLKTRKTHKRTGIMDASVNADLNTSVGSVLEDWSSQRMKRNIQIKAKRKFMEKVAELSLVENAESSNTEGSLSSLDQSSVLDVSAFDDSLSVSSMSLPTEDVPISYEKLDRTKAAREWLSKTGKEETAKAQEPYTSPLILTRHKLMILLYLALLYEGSTIQVSDLIRWIREGHLSFYEAAKHLPETCFLEGTYRILFAIGRKHPSYSDFVHTSVLMSTFLEMNDWPLPDVSELAKKYVSELQLPEMFSKLIERFVRVVPLAYNWRDPNSLAREIRNYEASILAILIIILKFLFGLDGRTEHQISKVASELNMLLQQQEDSRTTKLFVWKDWVRQLICRRAVLARYHFPTKHLICSEMFGNPFAYINHCRNWNDANAGFEEKYNLAEDGLLRVVQPALLNTLSSILEKLHDPDSCKNEDIKFPPSCTPYSVYIKKIIEKAAEMDIPLIAKPALDVLTEDFSKCDIRYLLLPQSVANLASALGQKLKIKNKSAQKKFKKISTKRKTTKILRPDWVKGEMYVSITNCTNPGRAAAKAKPAPDINKIFEANKKRMKEKKMQKKNSLEKNCNKAKEKQSRKDSKHIRKSKSLTSKDKKTKGDLKICSNSRKRRKEGLPSGNSKRIKLNKLLKLYVPSSAYWVNSEDIRFSPNSHFNLRDGEKLEAHVLPKFPFSFSWLLTECAFVSEVNKSSIFKEVLRIEQLCYRMSKLV